MRRRTFTLDEFRRLLGRGETGWRRLDLLKSIDFRGLWAATMDAIGLDVAASRARMLAPLANSETAKTRDVRAAASHVENYTKHTADPEKYKNTLRDLAKRDLVFLRDIGLIDVEIVNGHGARARLRKQVTFTKSPKPGFRVPADLAQKLETAAGEAGWLGTIPSAKPCTIPSASVHDSVSQPCTIPSASVHDSVSQPCTIPAATITIPSASVHDSGSHDHDSVSHYKGNQAKPRKAKSDLPSSRKGTPASGGGLHPHLDPVELMCGPTDPSGPTEPDPPMQPEVKPKAPGKWETLGSDWPSSSSTEPNPLRFLTAENVPPYPGFDKCGFVDVPGPPLITEDMSQAQRIELLNAAYRAAVRETYQRLAGDDSWRPPKAGFWPRLPKAPGKDKQPTPAQIHLLDCARLLEQHRCAPHVWAMHMCKAWIEIHERTLDKAPPLKYVYSPKVIGGKGSWGRHLAYEYAPKRQHMSPKGEKLRDDYLAMEREFMKRGVDTSKRAAQVAAMYFPDDSYYRRAEAAREEAEAMTAMYNELIKGGDWIWPRAVAGRTRDERHA